MILQINAERFLANLNALADIGRLPEQQGGGLDRRPFSAAERAARDFFRQTAQNAGLMVHSDGAANLSARLPGANPQAKTLLLGSHLDTVPNGGPYDGALGVIAALEVLQTVHEAGLTLPITLEAIAFTDEEGRFADFFGSLALAGTLTDQSIATFLSRAEKYPDDLALMQNQTPGKLTPAGIRSARRDPATLAGFLDLHIEQGPQLEKLELAVGVVTAIVGRRSMQLHFKGRADHAGTTPMSMRADALTAAARFIAQMPALVMQKFPGAVATCGGVTATPGVYNVIPGAATVLLEFRAAAVETLEQIKQALLMLAAECSAAEDQSFTATLTGSHAPAAMSEAMQTAIWQACQRLDYPTMTMPSGAGHDAQSLAGLIPTGMIFVPSVGGYSHSPDEHTAPADLISGANVLLHTVLILGQNGASPAKMN